MSHTKFERIWTNGYDVIDVSFLRFCKCIIITISFIHLYIIQFSIEYLDTYPVLEEHHSIINPKFSSSNIEGQGQGH